MTSGSEPWVEISIDLGNTVKVMQLCKANHIQKFEWFGSTVTVFHISRFIFCNLGRLPLMNLDHIGKRAAWTLLTGKTTLALWCQSGCQTTLECHKLGRIDHGCDLLLYKQILQKSFETTSLCGTSQNDIWVVKCQMRILLLWGGGGGVQPILMLFTFSIIFKEMQLCLWFSVSISECYMWVKFSKPQSENSITKILQVVFDF